MTNMLGLTSPKIVFCESSNIERVRLTLEQLGLLDIPVYSFDGTTNYGSMDTFLDETKTEEDFM